MIPVGTFIAKALPGPQFGISSAGKDYVCLAFAITRGDCVGQMINAYLYFTTEANTARSIESLRHCGCTFPGDDITNLTGVDANEVQLVIEHETHEGKTRAKVKWINSLTGGVKEEERMSVTERLSFKERMKANLLHQKASSAPQTVVDKLEDSDIPF